MKQPPAECGVTCGDRHSATHSGAKSSCVIGQCDLANKDLLFAAQFGSRADPFQRAVELLSEKGFETNGRCGTGGDVSQFGFGDFDFDDHLVER